MLGGWAVAADESTDALVSVRAHSHGRSDHRLVRSTVPGRCSTLFRVPDRVRTSRGCLSPDDVRAWLAPQDTLETHLQTTLSCNDFQAALTSFASKLPQPAPSVDTDTEAPQTRQHELRALSDQGVSDVTVGVLCQAIRLLRRRLRTRRARTAALAQVRQRGTAGGRPPSLWGSTDSLNGDTDRRNWPILLHSHYAANFSDPGEAASAELVLRRLVDAVQARRLDGTPCPTSTFDDLRGAVSQLRQNASPGMDDIILALLRVLFGPALARLQVAVVTRFRNPGRADQKVLAWRRAYVRSLPKSRARSRSYQAL